MRDCRLNKHELAERRAAHHVARAVREAYRINTVILLGNGRAAADVADALLIDPDTVRDYFKRYKKTGLEGLLQMSDFGSEALLDETQLAELDLHLHSHLYLTAQAVSTIALFQQIEQANPNAPRIVIFCDPARYYRSKAVTDDLKTSRIKLEFLPPYAPNLNLIARFWKFFKRQVLYNHYYDRFEKHKEACTKFFAELDSYAPQLRTLLAENFQIIGNKNPKTVIA